MMSCIEAVKYLYEYMDGEISDSHGIVVKKHLDNCTACRQRYEFEKGIRALVKAHCINTKAPPHLHHRIIEGIAAINKESVIQETASKEKITRLFFSPRSYAVAASLLLLIAGGIFYYTNYGSYSNDQISIVDNAVKNHVQAVSDSDNLVFNEKTSIVGNIMDYFGSNLNVGQGNSSPLLNSGQIRVVGGLPVQICGTSSSCFILNKGGNKLTLQVVRNSGLPMRNLEKVQFDTKEFYVGNCRGFNAVLWEEEGSTYCLTSDISADEILKVASNLTLR
ncbi:MAG TPA: mycothiol system anti-sigma-R factor [Candidatus Brocadiaceae bacterium]